MPRAHAALPPKRRRGVLVRVDAQATDEVLGTADPKLVEKLREFPVSALRRFLAEFGERSTGLKKDDIVARLVLRGPTVFADLPPQKIAPAGPLPAVRA